jgi:putative colanic acid biosynthesis acetyltransferase WcaF
LFLSNFDKNQLDRGRPRFVEMVWLVVSYAIVQSRFPWPSIVRKTCLTLFGAKIGNDFVCRESLYVHFPWKLIIGDNVWLGTNTYLHNLEVIVIGSNTSIGHQVFISTGSHDITLSDFPYKNAPVKVGSSVFLASRSVVLAGVEIGDGSVVAAGAVVTKTVPAWQVVAGCPAKTISIRKIES